MGTHELMAQLTHAQCATGSLDERGKVDWVQDLDFEMCLARPPPFPWMAWNLPIFVEKPGGFYGQRDFGKPISVL